MATEAKAQVADEVIVDHTKGAEVQSKPVTGLRWKMHKNGIGIVEDEPQVADLYKAAFTSIGMSISFIAGDGLEAIKAFKDSDPKPDIVIMDHRMPIMTGVAAMKEMQKLNLETRYVIVSADASIREEAIEAGALIFLEKPIKLKQLIGCIQNLRQ